MNPEDLSNNFTVPLNEPDVPRKWSERGAFSIGRPTFTVQLSAASPGNSHIFYNGIELEAVYGIDVSANADELTEVMVRFKGVNVNVEKAP